MIDGQDKTMEEGKDDNCKYLIVPINNFWWMVENSLELQKQSIGPRLSAEIVGGPFPLIWLYDTGVTRDTSKCCNECILIIQGS